MERNNREALEDLLEAVWLAREAETEVDLARCRPPVGDTTPQQLLDRLRQDGLVDGEGPGVRLTAAGEAAAERVVRRHRLAERLYTDLLRGHADGQQSFACRFEHVLSEEVAEAVCTLLGHPPTCPHGRRIPPGACCRRAAREVRPVVRPLCDFPPGAVLRVVFVTPRYHQRLDRLSSFGVLPGATVQLHQKQPAVVLRVGATEVALERDVAGEIYALPAE